jgi:hypothetical protein
MTHEELRIAALRFARGNKYNYKTHETNGLALSVATSEVVTAANDIPDVIGWRNGASYLIECKASRSDFKADAKKPQRNTGTGMGECRYYFCPKGLLDKKELPEGWGLIELDGRKATIVMNAPRRDLDVAAHQHEKRILLSLLRRVKMREFLFIQREVADGDLSI